MIYFRNLGGTAILLKNYLRPQLLFVANSLGLLVEYFIARPLLFAAIRVGAAQSRRRYQSGALRTLWGVTPIVTLPLKARCDLALGFRSESLVLTNYYITDDFTWNFKWTRFLVPKSLLQQAVLKLVLAAVLLRFDIVHYFADRGILPPEDGRFGIHADELRALRLAGKSVYVFTYGADVRTRVQTLSLGKWNFCRDCDDPGRYCICDDHHAMKIMARTSDRINRFVSLGDMLEYVPRPIHLAYWPVDTEETAICTAAISSGPLKIFHAPNHTHFKGTRYLERAIADLRREGKEIQLVEMSGVSNRAVIQGMAEADVVVDQLVGGAYGYTALEAMARSKPVISYVRDSLLIVGFDDCPLINATPDTINDVLLWCLLNRNRLERIGQQGRAYIEKHHCISAVAGRFAGLYRDTMPLQADIVDRLSTFQHHESQRANLIRSVEGWEHEWRAEAKSH